MGAPVCATVKQSATDLAAYLRFLKGIGIKTIELPSFLQTNSFGSLIGEGDLNAKLFFISGPIPELSNTSKGFYDLASGKLFLKILKAMQLDRGNVYISIPVTGSNRVPPEKIPLWRKAVILLIQQNNPIIICTLGESASRMMLETSLSLDQLRGRFHPLGSLKVIPTWHPARLLAEPSKKRNAWDDMKQIMAILEQ